MNFPIELSPELLSKALEVGLRPEDIREEFTHSRGPGGQNVNKRSTAVVLHHAPSGLVIRCEEHREQHQNRTGAYKHLILKLEEQMNERAAEIVHRQFTERAQKASRPRRVKEKMLEQKRKRAERKESRKPPEIH